MKHKIIILGLIVMAFAVPRAVWAQDISEHVWLSYEDAVTMFPMVEQALASATIVSGIMEDPANFEPTPAGLQFQQRSSYWTIDAMVLLEEAELNLENRFGGGEVKLNEIHDEMVTVWALMKDDGLFKAVLKNMTEGGIKEEATIQIGVVAAASAAAAGIACAAGGGGGGECVVPVPYPPTEAGLCNDGIDNDFDSFIDCLDPDCFGDPACPMIELICDDNMDNDWDSLIDCDDPDCAGDPACEPFCGNGTVDPGEDCDYGSTELQCPDGWYCTTDCLCELVPPA